ncbi:MAG TPA: HTTM domain-containing protein [Polyangia bacterium]
METPSSGRALVAGRFDRLRRRLGQPVDNAWLAAFRMLFGALMFWSCLRFFYNGWITAFYVRPKLHLKYWGFAWVQAWPGWGMYAHYAVLTALALCIALGLWYRIAIVLFFLGFSYAQLIDASLYLNHYYLVSLLALLLSFMPAHARWSLDARRSPALRAHTVPLWCLALLRFQVGVVYTFAGLAKLSRDWLLAGQPLGIWLASNTHVPLVGRYLDQPAVALAASWMGFLFDSTIVLWLSWRKTRLPAYLVVIVFHFFTHLLFPIGMFPLIMIVSALVFFSPTWPLALAARLRPASLPPIAAPTAPTSSASPQRPPSRAGLVVGLVYAVVQVLLPLRTHLYGGNVLWHEQGMRWSWRVMVREKNGSVTYRVRDPRTGRIWEVTPRDYLRNHQERELSTQPDLIAQLAHIIAADFRERLGRDVTVEVDAAVSLNGRPAAPLITPSADLSHAADGIGPRSYILPAPLGPPAGLTRGPTP